MKGSAFIMADAATSGFDRLPGGVTLQNALGQRADGASTPAAKTATALLEHGDIIEHHAAPAQDANAHATYNAQQMLPMQQQAAPLAANFENIFVTAMMRNQLTAITTEQTRMGKENKKAEAKRKGFANLEEHQLIKQGGNPGAPNTGA
jgi:hypothetical protein